MENNNQNPAGDNSNNQYLKQLNKLSHKISKPPITASAFRKPPPPPPPEPPQVGPQPPVYNINKSDFRDIVQKLTGSPAHSLVPGPGPGPTPPPMGASSSKPSTSRLHRIRPPPLAQLSNRPPAMPFFNPNPLGGFRPTSGGPPPLSPLPPLPSVHAAAESPVSAYMRFLRSSSGVGFSEPTRQFSPLAPLVSPRWNALASEGGMFPPLPTSPLPFGCMSPQSTAASYPPLFPLSPTAFPLSPTVPISSPKGRSL